MKRWKGIGVPAYPVLSKDIDYNVIVTDIDNSVMSTWEVGQNGESESDKEKILKSMVGESGKISLFIHFLF